MKIYIPLPDSFEPPQGAEAGEEFDVSARVKLEGDKLCVLKINGIPLISKEHDDMPERRMGEGAMKAARMEGY